MINLENESNSKTPMIIGIVVVVLVLGGLGFVLLNSSQNSPQSTTPTATTTSSTAPSDTASDVQVISMTGKEFRFTPEEIRVKAGQKVKVELKVEDMMHDFVIDELNVSTPIGQTGETVVVEFTPTETGEYEFYCSVGEHRAKGMVGTLIVE